ncbi:hypothetical protein TNCV_3324451 [Trichonephila clavipes]|nr:hypothetical protein TNCV_3324451 [Trichonephila clavipes]
MNDACPEHRRRESISELAYLMLFEYKLRCQGKRALTTWPPMEVHAVVRCKWTWERVTCPLSIDVYRPCIMKRLRFVKWMIAGVACLTKEGRMSRTKVEVGLPSHPQKKTTFLENRV